MRGSVRYQVQSLYIESGISRIGHSKHCDKQAAREKGARTWHELGAHLGIYSYAEADLYRGVWRQILQHARTWSGVKDVELLNGKHVAAFLESHLAAGVALSTFRVYAAAGEKLGVALQWYAAARRSGREYSFSDAIKDVRKEAAGTLRSFSGSRAYEAPERLIAAIADTHHQLAARLQNESGARVHEISRLTSARLRGAGTDPYLHDRRGYIEVKGKGGKINVISVAPATYRAVAAIIGASGGFRVDYQAYRQSLAAASQATGQRYNGTHGLRWTWAQRRYKALLGVGLSEVQAEVIVSREMTHERPDITRHYLQGKL